MYCGNLNKTEAAAVVATQIALLATLEAAQLVLDSAVDVATSKAAKARAYKAVAAGREAITTAKCTITAAKNRIETLDLWAHHDALRLARIAAAPIKSAEQLATEQAGIDYDLEQDAIARRAASVMVEQGLSSLYAGNDNAE